MEFKFTCAGASAEIEPKLLTTADGGSAIRRITIDKGPYGELCIVTAELLPAEALAIIKDFVLAFTVPDGRKVTEIHLEGGEVLRFPLKV